MRLRYARIGLPIVTLCTLALAGCIHTNPGTTGGGGESSSAPLSSSVSSSSSSPSSSSASSSSSSLPPIANTQDCRRDIDWIAWRHQREFRAALFGLTPAKDASLMEVRFATEDQSIWIKTKMGSGATTTAPAVEGEWESVSPGYESTIWSDTTMGRFMDVTPRRGIFEVRRRLSTELVPHITQAYRSLECRLANLCQLLDASLNVSKRDPQDVTVKILGCNDVSTQTLPTCHLPNKQSTLPEKGDLRAYCTAMTESLRTRESQVLRLVGEYDAGYRSGIQFSGIFRQFLGQMRGVITGSLRSATQMITSFSRIPCFIGACDGNPASTPPTEP
ncbi:hypothetical protein FJZ27_04790 [Candidatus Peribacteria bacterium]|nr:hypothetical protein [Candidatus Peribacteria bacterium]